MRGYVGLWFTSAPQREAGYTVAVWGCWGSLSGIYLCRSIAVALQNEIYCKPSAKGVATRVGVAATITGQSSVCLLVIIAYERQHVPDVVGTHCGETIRWSLHHVSIRPTARRIASRYFPRRRIVRFVISRRDE